MKPSLSTALLIFTALLFGAVSGIGVYQHAVTMPRWFASPPKSFEVLRQGSAAEARFWIPLQAALAIGLIASLVLNWKMPQRRLLLLMALGGYLAVAIVTGAYFAPEIMRFSKMTADTPWTQGLSARAHRWLSLSWIRQSAIVLANVAVLLALAARRERFDPV